MRLCLINRVLMLPGQRRDVIVDFTAFAGQTITVIEQCADTIPLRTSIPFATRCVPCPADQPEMNQIMQFVVAPAVTTPDTSCNPAVAGQCTRPTPLVKLTDGAGNVAPGVVIDKVRRLVLKEFQGAGGPAGCLRQQHPVYWDEFAEHSRRVSERRDQREAKAGVC